MGQHFEEGEDQGGRRDGAGHKRGQAALRRTSSQASFAVQPMAPAAVA